ncbi:MAG: hypothetical protein ABIO21_17265 [Pseudomonas sp.]
MSRSLGLREDQREGEVLATLIFGLFPLDPVWCIREQARTHRGSPEQHETLVGAGLLAKRPDQPMKL